jgi:hypothetical protein
MSILSFTGILFIYQTTKKYVSNSKIYFFSLIGIPSIGFWTSGLTKESLMTFGLGLFILSLSKLLEKRTLKFSFFLTIATGILLFNKPYAGIIIIPTSFIFMIGEKSNWNLKSLWASVTLIVGIAISTAYFPEPFNSLSKISYKQRDMVNIGKGGIFLVTDSSFCAFNYKYRANFNKIADQEVLISKETKGEYKLFGQQNFIPFKMNASSEVYGLYLIQPPSNSFVETKLIDYSHKNLFLSIPNSLFNAMVRPLPIDNGSSLKYFSFLNNLIVIFLIIFAVIYRKSKPSTKEIYLLTYCIIVSLFTLIIIGLTTPILGAIVRYKVVAEIFILIFVFILLRPLNQSIK